MNKDDCTPETLNPDHYEPFSGTVSEITDGDTLKVLVQGSEIRIRLWGIDAPEMDQPHGPSAKHALEESAPKDSPLRIYPTNMDRYGRLVATTGLADDWAVNFRMVASGNAYHVDAYESRGNRCLIEAEKLAKISQQGLWNENAQGSTRPWEHRKQK